MNLLGCMYVTAVFQSYIGSYYKVPKDGQIVDDLLPGCVFLYIFTSPIGGLLAQRGTHPKLLIAIGSTVTISLFYASSFAKDIKLFAGLYVTAFAFNHGLSYMAPIQNGWLWFPDKPGLISGIIISGFGSGALIFDNVLTALINPDNASLQPDGTYPADSGVDDRFEKSWRILITCWAGLAVAGFLLIFKGPLPEANEN